MDDFLHGYAAVCTMHTCVRALELDSARYLDLDVRKATPTDRQAP